MGTPEPDPPPPPRWGVDERATWAAYAAALRGVPLARAGDERTPTGAAPAGPAAVTAA